jgi:arylsulfatase A-like enzyme
MKSQQNTRRQFLTQMGLGATGLAFAQCGTAGSAKRPNILFFFTDDQRFDTIHALGNEQIITPNMDALVARGVTFTQNHILGSNSGAVCAPSRAMLMTGAPYFKLGNDIREIWKAPPEQEGGDYESWPEMLRKSGYHTFGTGKQHNGRPLFARQFSYGENIFFGGMSDHLEVPINDFDPTGAYSKEDIYPGAKFSSELFSDAAVNFLQQHDGVNPFAMYISYTAPHDPRMAPEQYKQMYNPVDIPVPENFMAEHSFDNGELVIRDEKLAPFPRTREIVQEHIAAYYAMITHVDAQIGRVMQALEATGEADNTIIIFAGDNGLAVGQHGLMGKQNLYDHSVRVPLVISGPGIPRGESRDTLCYLYDLCPTICELAGAEVPAISEGNSLVPALHHASHTNREYLYGAYKDYQRSIKDGRYKLIEYAVNGTRTTQLFDLQKDPKELLNLADDRQYTDHLRNLRDALQAMRPAVGDQDGAFWDVFNRN